MTYQSMKDLFSKFKLDAILVTKPENIRYLSGFVGSFGELIVTPIKRILITDSRYKVQAKRICFKNVEILIIEDYQKDMSALFKKLHIHALGFESRDFTYSKFLSYKKLFKGIKLKPLKNEIDQLRMIKTAEEIKKIKASQKLNEKVLKIVPKVLEPGVSEKDIANMIVTLGTSLGAEAVSFDPIVAFGKNSASPHHTPNNVKLKSTDIVLIDMGFKLDGYCSDMSRTFLPKNPSKEMREMYNLVLLAQETCIKKLCSGILASEGDKFSRDVFAKAGVAENFTHANGHGVGLEIHESPSLSSKLKHTDRKIKLQTGMVVTVEPGLYFENKFGIRIEDMVLITDKGCENLTRFEK